MRYLILSLIILLSGCLQPDNGPVNPYPEPDPPPVVLTPEAAAAAFARVYSAALADVTSDLAKRAASGEFEVLADVNDARVAAYKEAHARSQTALIAAMNKTLTDSTGEKPGAESAELLEQLAAGFRKGARP